MYVYMYVYMPLHFSCWFISFVFLSPLDGFQVDDRVYYLPEVFVIKSVVKTGVYRVQGSVSKIRKVAEAGTLFPSSITGRAEMTQTEAASLKASVAAVGIELESHKYHLQAFKDDLAREKQTAEKLGQ